MTLPTAAGAPSQAAARVGASRIARARKAAVALQELWRHMTGVFSSRKNPIDLTLGSPRTGGTIILSTTTGRWWIPSMPGSGRRHEAASMVPGMNFRPLYPTDPSIWSWMSLFISTAYSSGSSLVIGSTKPETIMALASASERPRLLR